MSSEPSQEAMTHRFPRAGRLVWIGLRPARRGELAVVHETVADPESGLIGDHYNGGSSGQRHVTCIQYEHLQAVASLLGREPIDPRLTRRNLVISGINLLALRDHAFAVGEVVLLGTGLCQPCSRMEENLGPGGYNAMRGHGGITARIIQGGTLRLGDPVRFLPDASANQTPPPMDKAKTT
jgi:MOSC domain-containing protein YiiM